mgnify:CR=1 FL=1|tara:strand:+ start:266 stop:961 length:696 start_codon:yes stop_codon:yes gene_type:complete
MKIGVFAYNFKHWKTQVGLFNLCMSGNKPDVIFASDPVDLNFYRSKIRVSPKDQFLWHPREIANYFGIDYRVVVHNSEETSDLVKSYNLDVGVILGARILKPVAFRSFKLGVINMHPGVLPENRGLDNLKWAILKNLPQGVTSHLIDEKIDRGLLLIRKEITVYKDDTLVDLHVRIQNLEQSMMIESLDFLKNREEELPSLEKGSYHKSVPEEMEKTLMEKFKEYKNMRGV